MSGWSLLYLFIFFIQVLAHLLGHGDIGRSSLSDPMQPPQTFGGLAVKTRRYHDGAISSGFFFFFFCISFFCSHGVPDEPRWIFWRTSCSQLPPPSKTMLIVWKKFIINVAVLRFLNITGFSGFPPSRRTCGERLNRRWCYEKRAYPGLPHPTAPPGRYQAFINQTSINFDGRYSIVNKLSASFDVYHSMKYGFTDNLRSESTDVKPQTSWLVFTVDLSCNKEISIVSYS